MILTAFSGSLDLYVFSHPFALRFAAHGALPAGFGPAGGAVVGVQSVASVFGRGADGASRRSAAGLASAGFFGIMFSRYVLLRARGLHYVYRLLVVFRHPSFRSCLHDN